jgi:predicted DNA-binding ribbon-helix-helix protein
VSLEDAFWSGLKEIAARRVTTLSELVSEVDMAQATDETEAEEEAAEVRARGRLN